MERVGAAMEGFSTPQQELDFLRQQLAEKEKVFAARREVNPAERAAAATLAGHQMANAERLLDQAYRLPPKQSEAIALELKPETHDRQMEELLGLLLDKGIKNTLGVLAKLNSPHLEDDFHRLLVQYLKHGQIVSGLKETSTMAQSLKMTLYEIALPSDESSDGEKAAKPLKELLSSMEQFYAGLRGLNFTLELAVSSEREEIIFYAAVPDGQQELFTKQLLAIFPHAKVMEQKDDYNIFNTDGVSVAAQATLKAPAVLPLKTYDQFDYDPLNIIINSFARLKQVGEGAALQLCFAPAEDHYLKNYQSIRERLNKGEKTKEVIESPDNFIGGFAKEIKSLVLGGEVKKPDENGKTIDQITIDLVNRKTATPLILANIRLIASAASRAQAEHILTDLEAAFNQFEAPGGNRLEFERLRPRQLAPFLRQFSFRSFSTGDALPLSLGEAASLFHLPSAGSEQLPSLKQAKAGTAPAPTDAPATGTLLGVNRHHQRANKIYLTAEDRLRHFYTIGQTGTGKSTLLKNMIVQDILAGEGVCYIDPHGVDIEDILSAVPRERYEDVIYFDPSYTARPMALNMLEYDERYPEQKTFVVNELFSIFQKLYGAVPESMGPIFEQYFRNATMLVIEDPSSGSTLLEVSRVMANKAFRDLKISRCKNPVVVQFWREQAEKAGGEASLANMVPYITSKFDVFLANDIMRPIIAQEHSSFNFREIMDGRKILLVNLAKGRLGDINSNLLGLILVGKILMSALSRVDNLSGNLAPFYLYIDEFQNVTTPSIATILSEARKYKLSLTMAHQFIAQLEENIRDAVFGNVGSIAAFRVGVDDGEYLEKQFAPVFSARDLTNLDNHNAYLKILVNGRPTKPFNIETLPPPTGDRSLIAKLKELSYLKFGGDREQIEAGIMKKYEPKL